MTRSRPCPICQATGEHDPLCLVALAAREHAAIGSSRRKRDKLVKRSRKKGVSQQSIADALGCSKRLVQLMEKEAS